MRKDEDALQFNIKVVTSRLLPSRSPARHLSVCLHRTLRATAARTLGLVHARSACTLGLHVHARESARCRYRLN